MPISTGIKHVTDQVIFFAAPHSAEKTIRNAIDAYNSGLRPVISETRPLIGVRIVCARRYDWGQCMVRTDEVLRTVPIQEYSAWVAPRSPAIVGSAVAMI